jgi:hypothetical protein
MKINSVYILFLGTVNLNSNTVNGLPNSHNGTSSTAVNGVSGGTVHRTSSMNGQYMDTSPSGQYADQREYVNGASSYSSSQVRQMELPAQSFIRLVVKEYVGCHSQLKVSAIFISKCSFPMVVMVKPMQEVTENINICEVIPTCLPSFS